MSQTAAPLATFSVGVRSLIPLLYVAWSDRVLTPSEIRLLKQKATQLTYLSDADRRLLSQWTNPAQPPDRELFQMWRVLLHDTATKLPTNRRRSLVELGVEMAKQSVAGEPGAEALGEVLSEANLNALRELETALGTVNIATYHSIFPDVQREEALERAETDTFELAKLTELLDRDAPKIKRKMRILLTDPIFQYRDMPLKEDHRQQVLEWCRMLAKQGLGALTFREEYGGENSMRLYAAAFEMLGYHDLSLTIKFGVQFGLWGGSVNQLGTDRHRRRYLPETGTLELAGAFAMSERRHGSNVRDLQTTARLDRETDEWVITTPTERDHKEWIGNAARHGQVATVFAQLVIQDGLPGEGEGDGVEAESYGVHAFVVPIRDENGDPMPGVRIEDSGHKMGLNGVDNGRLWFDGVRVPRENLLDRFASVTEDGVYSSPIPSAAKRFFVMLGTLVGGRIAVGSGANSAAKAGLTIAVRYGARRRQFGPPGADEVPLLDYLTHQRRLLPYVATSTGLSFALHELAERFAALSAGSDTREIEAGAAALKSMASWHCTAALQECREACGGEGYRWTSRIAHRKADSDIFTTFEGDNTVLMLQVAKGLLGGYRAEFSDLNLFGMLRYIREQAAVRLGEPNPLTRRDASTEHLVDPAWHAELFERRERTLLVKAAARLKRRIDAGCDSFDAFVQVQDHLVELATAHAERLVLDAFQRGVEQTEDAQLQTVLRLQCALYALTRIEAHRGWYLEQNLFEAAVSKGVRREVNALLARLRPIAVETVDAFGIPDALLGSDIARSPVDPPPAGELPGTLDDAPPPPVGAAPA